MKQKKDTLHDIMRGGREKELKNFFKNTHNQDVQAIQQQKVIK